MSYGVALRNGVPFTLGTIAALCVNATGSAWSPLALWPNGAASPGMWIDPSLLTASFNDYLGTTPVATPGTVADTSNPVGLALDIRAGATVLTDPGNHMLQSTSAARPLESARVNLLQYTEDFTNGYWANATATVTPNYGTAPDGTQTSTRLQFAGANLAMLKGNILSTPAPAAASCYVKGTAGETVYFENNLATATITTLTGAWQLASKADGTGTSFVIGTYGGATARDIEVWHPQFQLGLDVTAYQSVPGNGSSYSATGITPFQLYDGVDDGMATASFAAGTLINGMDCMIPVRRDSAGVPVMGLWNDVFRWFAAPDATDSVQVCYGVCGTPTVWVDGVQLTGGTAVKRDTLAAALTVGDWHIMEFRNLDLSIWETVKFGNYPAALVNGARGDIMLFESTASTEDKDAARQYLADKYGVTLA